MRRCSSTWPSARRTSPRSSPRPSTWAAAAWSRRSASRWRPTTRGSWAAGRATEIGDVSFSIRRYRDRFGCDVYLLADALDIPYGARVSPGAADFLVEAAAHVSYARAARLLARHGLRVRATTVMRCMRDAGSLCAEEDRWIGYIFLDDFGRTKPAFLSSTGVMYPSVEWILKLLYQCT